MLVLNRCVLEQLHRPGSSQFRDPPTFALWTTSTQPKRLIFSAWNLEVEAVWSPLHKDASGVVALARSLWPVIKILWKVFLLKVNIHTLRYQQTLGNIVFLIEFSSFAI